MVIADLRNVETSPLTIPNPVTNILFSLWFTRPFENNWNFNFSDQSRSLADEQHVITCLRWVVKEVVIFVTRMMKMLKGGFENKRPVNEAHFHRWPAGPAHHCNQYNIPLYVLFTSTTVLFIIVLLSIHLFSIFLFSIFCTVYFCTVQCSEYPHCIHWFSSQQSSERWPAYRRSVIDSGIVNTVTLLCHCNTVCRALIDSGIVNTGISRFTQALSPIVNT